MTGIGIVNGLRDGWRSGWRALLCTALLGIGAGGNAQAAGEPAFGVTRMERSTVTGTVFVWLDSVRKHYIIARRGDSADQIVNPFAVVPGDIELFSDRPVSWQENLYYQFELVSHDNPYDTDGDGWDDLRELENIGWRNPLAGGDTLNPLDSAFSLADRNALEAFARRDNVPGAMGVREVKFLITDVDTDDPVLYLLNTTRHEFHYYFAREVLGHTLDLGTFNQVTYWTETNRQYLAGSLIVHDNYVSPEGVTGVVTMEFWPSDGVPFRFVEMAWERVRAALPFLPEGGLRYHANGETQRGKYLAEKALFDASDIAMIDTEELFGNLSYSPLNLGTSYGRLRVADGASALSVRDIVIFRNIPNSLPHVGGIITELPQTPLSHVNLIARQNDTPNAYVKEASTRADIAPLIGKWVRYAVTADALILEEATLAEVEEHLEGVRPQDVQHPVRDIETVPIRPLDEIAFSDARAYGSKAANVAELGRILPDGVAPDGFAVPFFFYDSFMRQNGLYEEALLMMGDEDFQNDPLERETTLREFRQRIIEGEVSFWADQAFDWVQSKFPYGTPLRCRSSTNNEDLEGFSGAGLYSSFTHHVDEGPLSKSIKQVWASLWTYRAYEERSFYRIPQLEAAMGVLIHPAYKDERANGVAVTKNLIDPNWTGYYVNVQQGEFLVTNPSPDDVPEEFLVARLLGDEFYEIQYVRSSNRVAAGQRVLTREQVFELADALRLINVRFAQLYGIPWWDDDDFAMDVEFKITREGRLAIKQARPWVD